MENRDMEVYDFKNLYDVVNELKLIFFSTRAKSLLNDEKKQEYFNNLLNDYSKNLKLYKRGDTIKSGVSINNDLSDDNKLYTSINMVNIADKSAHVLDDDIKEFSKSFIKMYELYSSKELDEISFMKEFNEICPEIENINKEFIKFINKIIIRNDRYLTDKEFINIYDCLKDNNDIKYINNFFEKELKIDPKNDDNALELFNLLKDNKNRILEAYIYKKYMLAKSMLNLQNDMFAIKNYYIEIIVELLKDNNFKNIKHKLVNIDNEYKLIIDDDLSNHIEIVLSDLMKEKLIKEYNYKFEDNNIKEIPNNKIKKNTKKQTKFKEKVKKEISSSTLGVFLNKYEIHSYDDILKFADGILKNENYTEDIKEDIAYNYYYNIYQSLDPKEKNLFILDSLYKPHDEYDLEDLQIINKLKKIYEKNNNETLVSEILINKNRIKELFKNDRNKSIDTFINNYIKKNNIVENNHEKTRNI